MKKYMKNLKLYAALALTWLIQSDSFAIDAGVNFYLRARSSCINRFQSATSGSKIAQGLSKGLNLASKVKIDETTGFKASMALLGFWSLPLLCNLAIWQWKKYKVKRRIRAEPNQETLTTFHTNRVHNGSNELSNALADVTSSQSPCFVPNSLTSIKSEDNVDLAENSQHEIKRRIALDMHEISYQPLMPAYIPALHSSATRRWPVDNALQKVAPASLIFSGMACAKRLLYDSGLKVLWCGLAYGPGKIETWATMAATEVALFTGLSEIAHKIFHRSFNQKIEDYKIERYLDIGEHLFLHSCLFLNMMVIKSFVTKRLNPS